MDKREDLELLDLQELALRHQSVCPRKSLEEKCMIVKAYLTNHVPITQLSKEFGIPRVTIWRWIRTFADGSYAFCYLSMITDCYTKEIISWYVGQTMEAWCSVECLMKALETLGTEEVINLMYG